MSWEMDPNAERPRVEWKIFDRTWHIKDDDGQRELAKWIDSEIEEVRKRKPTLKRVDTVILAAWNIATKYRNIAEKHQLLEKEHGLLQDENDSLRSTLDFQKRFPLIKANSIPSGTKAFDESGNLLGIIQAGKIMTEGVRARIRERAEHHHTRRWFERQMIAYLEGKLKLSDKEFRAMMALARSQGWNYPRSKKNAG